MGSGSVTVMTVTLAFKALSRDIRSICAQENMSVHSGAPSLADISLDK
jgi:hypothetical protein